MEKQVSIIIDGVRYDTEVAALHNECAECDLKELCEIDNMDGIVSLCYDFLASGYCFKKSDKKLKYEIYGK